jgi:4-amino-4-deoxy-L-arabinose transferase-like glycosyltransferase
MRRIALLLILVAAATARLWHLTAGVPHAVGIDEPQVIDRAIRILQTGDWNTHIYDSPSLVIYVHAVVAIFRFLSGALNGEWNSLETFNITAIYTTGRFVAAMIGVGTVWAVYRLGTAMASTRVGLLAAAQLAVLPMHVRESRFILTDVPMTLLTTLAMLLAVRAMRLGTVRAYAWAGAMCGFAAAAKYNGGVALVGVLVALLINERSERDPGRKLAAAVAAAALAFVAAAPYILLDIPGFLDGFAAQFARFARAPPSVNPAWLLYLKHLSPAWARLTVPLAITGAIVLLWRPRTRGFAIPVALFTAAYFYVLASHAHVFGRYALPIVPLLAVFSSAAILEILAALQRVRLLQRPPWQPVLLGAALLLVLGILGPPVAQTMRWIDQQKRADTRQIAADWLKANTPRGTRVAVENSGPTYLGAAGFKVAGVERLIDKPLDFYRTRVDYLILSSADLSAYGEYLGAGPTVFQINPTLQRWGPPIRILRLGS